jgi:hypothetical protein
MAKVINLKGTRNVEILFFQITVQVLTPLMAKHLTCFVPKYVHHKMEQCYGVRGALRDRNSSHEPISPRRRGHRIEGEARLKFIVELS